MFKMITGTDHYHKQLALAVTKGLCARVVHPSVHLIMNKTYLEEFLFQNSHNQRLGLKDELIRSRWSKLKVTVTPICPHSLSERPGEDLIFRGWASKG